MANIVLKSDISRESLLAYFNSICRLADETNSEFPVNLDEVWPLVYPRKEHAVRDLMDNFIQDVDYQVFLKNGENPLGGRPTNIYNISISCLEYLIARKKREVFEVYRQVFHAARRGELPNALPKTYAEALRQLANEVEEREKSQLLLKEKTQRLDESREWFSIKRWAKLHRKNWRSYSWRKLKAVSHELGYEVKKIFDGNYDEVNIYHKAVFEAVYNE